MSKLRHIDLPEKDAPLRADVSLLGSLVGDVLVDQHGDDLLERVETVRKAAIRPREGEPVTGFESDKARALLAYLAVEAHRAHQREKLAGMLWPRSRLNRSPAPICDAYWSTSAV